MSVLRKAAAPLLHIRNSSFLTKQFPLQFSPKLLSQLRNFGSQVSCWSCGNADGGSGIFCPKCNSLQKVDTSKNYFDILDLPLSYNVDSNALSVKFREMQSFLHPDKFSNKSQEEQDISLEWSSLVNKAYKTLLAPIKRGEYILERKGVQLPKDNSALDQMFLLEMMERNEEVDEANSDKDLRQLLVKVRKELSETSEELAKAFEKNRTEDAVEIIVKMKYLISLESSIKEKSRRLGFVD
ncbi:iron-sulfur cluster co-chaperone protein HscB-like [Phlebotomus argentipes]|uniref:iron-sulfur cluster co-chaperone protein HscB-like n=1 Tax=Phlebotomus argentipes TaxID=94469 RepID=UPI0028931A30|nr:iron-sulfur cluster co-chaperone protein HscB-like [Phlebotomus argentipes]